MKRWFIIIFCFVIFTACQHTPEEIALHTQEVKTATAVSWTDTPAPINTSTLSPTTTPTLMPTQYGGGNGNIVFSSKQDGDFDIYIMNSDGSNLQQLTDNDWGDYSKQRQWD